MPKKKQLVPRREGKKRRIPRQVRVTNLPWYLIKIKKMKACVI
jgi:hypothetical protein